MDYKCNSCGHAYTATYLSRCPSCKGHYVRPANGMGLARRATEPYIDSSVTIPVENISSDNGEPAADDIQFTPGEGDSGGGGASGDF